MRSDRTGGELVVEVLGALGVDTVFGIPGGQTLAIMEAIRKSPGVNFVTARHDGAAAVMADAYGRLTGTPGVCLATTGPGATNLLTGVGGAHRDSSPVLLLTCNNNSADLGKDDAQNADHVAIFRPLVKYTRLVTSRAAITQSVEEAWLAAVTGNPGPAHLDFTRDAVESVGPAGLSTPTPHPLLSWSSQRPEPDRLLLQRAADRLAAAQRPVLWLGSGVTRSRAGASALALGEAADIPIITTYNGIGSVPTTHPLVFGAHSRMGTALSHEVLREADLVLAVGNGLNAVSTSRWRLQLPEVIQIDIEPGNLALYYPRQTLGIAADAKIALEQLLKLINGRGDDQRSPQRRDWLAGLTDARRKWQEMVDTSCTLGTTSGTASPVELVRRLTRCVPEDTLLIADAGNPGLWSFLWEFHKPNSYLKPVGFGNMGFSVPAAVAAATLDAERPIVVLVGDGSLGMSLGELETLGRVGGRVCVVVLNDAGYGNIRQEQQFIYGDDHYLGVTYSDTDFSVVGGGLGLATRRLVDLAELDAAVGSALGGDAGPTLLDVVIDPALNVWTYPPFQHGALDGR